FERTLGKTHYYLIFPLSGAGRCEVLLGRPATALPLLERAVAIPAVGQGKLEQTVARFFHGRALVETGKRAGLEEARAGPFPVCAPQKSARARRAAGAGAAGRAARAGGARARR